MKTDQIKIQRLIGSEILPFIDQLAQLRIQVFREFPYLYDGDDEYEKKYLQRYLDCPESVLIVAIETEAKENERIVGASTAIPLSFEMAEIQSPFLQQGLPIQDIFYFGESVLLPAYRGQGIGKRFFEEREKAARETPQKFSMLSFCAVERASDDFRRPPQYRPLDTFWQGLGFRKAPHLWTSLSWKEREEPDKILDKIPEKNLKAKLLENQKELAHKMVFWIKAI